MWNEPFSSSTTPGSYYLAKDMDAIPLACPFCGETPDLYFCFGGGGPPPRASLVCEGCGAEGPNGHGQQRDDYEGSLVDAVRRWNERSGQGGAA